MPATPVTFGGTQATFDGEEVLWDTVARVIPRTAQVRDQIRVELSDPHGNILGQLHPTLAPAVEADVDASVPRRLTGLQLDPDEAADVNLYSDRLRPIWTQDGVDYPLGVFAWSSVTKVWRGWNIPDEGFSWTSHDRVGVDLDGGTCHDLSILLRFPFTTSYGIPTGANLADALADLVGQAGIVDHNIDSSPLTADQPLGWAAGDPLSDAVDQVCSRLSYRWWFDRHGQFQARTAPEEDVGVPDHWYDEDEVDPGPSSTRTPSERPNMWMVLGGSDAELVGVYTLPASHPASESSRGYVVLADVIEAPGITSVAAAEQRARQAAEQARRTVEVQIATTPQPAHDLHELVAWRGQVYREVGWTLPLQVGSAHVHRLVRSADEAG